MEDNRLTSREEQTENPNDTKHKRNKLMLDQIRMGYEDTSYGRASTQ